MNVFPAPPGRPRWRMYVVAGLVVWVLISLGGLAVFVASLNSDFDIEEALNEKYAATSPSSATAGSRSSPSTGDDSACRVEGEIGNLDDLRLVCTPRKDTPPLRGTGPSPVE